MTDKELVQLARKRLWIAEVGFDPDGSITFNATGLSQALDENCRMLARGRPPALVPFAVCESLELAEALCDAMEERLCKYAEDHGQPKPITLRDQLAALIRQWQDREREEETEDEDVTAPAEVAGRWEH